MIFDLNDSRIHVYKQRITWYLFSYVLCISLQVGIFVFLLTSHNIFVGVMESLEVPISKMKCFLTTHIYLIPIVCKSSCKIKWFYSLKGFKKIGNVFRKCDMKDPLSDNSVGMCPVLLPGMFILVLREVLLEILFSDT